MRHELRLTLWERQTLIEAGTIGVTQGPAAQVNLMQSVEHVVAANIGGDFV